MKFHKGYIETAVFTVFFLAAGLLFSRHDPLSASSGFDYSVLFLSLITLFYGFMPGLLVLSAFCIFAVFYYQTTPYMFLFENLLFMFVFGEFNLYWNRIIRKAQEQGEYYSVKLKELSKAFYSLKVSHDQLEKNYILKPVSIRSLLEKIKDTYNHNKRDSYNELLRVFARYFGVEGATYYTNIAGSFSKTASIGNAVDLDEEDPLVVAALDEKIATYINIKSSEKDYDGDYLAVIPAISGSDEIHGILLISRMPFISFNKGNLEMISVVLSYFVDQAIAVEMASPYVEKYPYLSEEIITETIRLSSLYDKFKLESMVVILSLEESYFRDSAAMLIRESMRSSDIYQEIVTGGRQTIVIVMPLSSDSTAYGFARRINETIDRRLKPESIEDLFTYKIVRIEGLEQTLSAVDANIVKSSAGVHTN